MEILLADVNEYGGDSINNCIFEATGQYILFLDSEADLEPGVLVDAVNTAVSHNLDMYLCPDSNIKTSTSFFFTDHDVLTGNHDVFILSGLLDNCINLYKKKLISNLRFAYGSSSEYLVFNLRAIDKAASVGYDPKPFWKGDIYPGFEGYRNFHHNLFTESYLCTIELLARDHMISDTRIERYKNRRINEFLTQLAQYPDAPLSLEECLFEIFALSGDIKDLFESIGAEKLLEEKVLLTCQALICSHSSADAGVMAFALDGIKELFKAGQVPKNDIQPGVVATMVVNYLNPANIGVFAYQALMNDKNSL